MRLKKPYHEIKDGRVKATIWHEERDGGTQFNVAFTRLFLDNERWWDSACFHLDDMPALGRLADDVHLWIAEQSAKYGQADGGSEG